MKRIFALALALCFVMIGCSNTLDDLRADAEALNKRLIALETDVAALNEQIGSVYALMNGQTVIVGCTATSQGYRVELADGRTIVVYDGAQIEHAQPIYGVNDEGYWIVSLDGGETFETVTDASGNPLSARPQDGEDGAEGAAGATPKVKVDTEGYWMVSYDDGETYDYLTDGSMPSAELTTEARVVEMEEDLANMFLAEMKEYYGYTDHELAAIGAPLMVEPRAFGTIRAFCAVGAALLLAGVLMLVLHWRKVSAKIRRAKEEAPGPDLD